MNPAGRRSGKTEIAKRKLIRKALTCPLPDGRFIFSAPTREQAKRIYWNDMQAMLPKAFVKKKNVTELSMTLLTGTTISIVGMDRPERIEGDPLDGIVLDEYANMKPEAWESNIRPALSTYGRPGWAMFIGVPEGRNHYWHLRNKALERDNWDVFTWKSIEILPEDEINEARADMDPLLFAQEYEADFTNFSGACYYAFSYDKHIDNSIEYDPDLPLIFCFDFNVEPGIAVVLQEQYGRTVSVGEVHIPRNSNTVAVCRRLVADWGHHKGRVEVYGDATGGARGTAKVQGSDWDLVRIELRSFTPVYFIKKRNPAERARVNAVNTRLLTADGQVRFVCGKTPKFIECLEGVVLLEGGSGEIDKRATPHLTHMSDAVGYYVEYRFPVNVGAPTPVQYV